MTKWWVLVGALCLAHAGVAQAQEQDGEVVVITESRGERPLAETTTAVEVITRRDIVRSGAQNVAAVLAAHPGIDIVKSYRGSAIRMQGLDPDYVLVLVDGERAIGRIGGALDLERFAVDDIERIEIIKGASSAMYGSDALAGVVNIITRKATQSHEAELRLSMGSLGAVDVAASGGARHGDLRSHVTAGWHRGEGYDLNPATPATDASAYDEARGAARATYAVRRGLEVGARGSYLLRDQAGVAESAAGAVLDQTTRTETASASVDAKWRATGTSVVSARGRYGVWRDQYSSDQRGSDALDVYEVAREDVAEATIQYDRTIGANHFATVGVDGLAERLAADRLDRDGARQRIAGFAQHTWVASSAPRVAIVPGVRVDLDTQFGAHASPKLAVRWDVTPRWIARASYGRGLRAPGFRELLLRFENPSAGYRVVGNPDLRPETSASVVAGVEARFGARAWVSVGAFHHDIEHLIATDLADDGTTSGMREFVYVNIASARARGVEGTVQVALVADLDLDLTYTLTDTLDRDTGTALPGRARHRGAVALSYRLPAPELVAYARASATGRRRFFEDGAAVDEPGYVLVEGRVEGRVHDRVTLFGGIANALNAGDPELLPIPPRSVYGGLTAEY